MKWFDKTLLFRQLSPYRTQSLARNCPPHGNDLDHTVLKCAPFAHRFQSKSPTTLYPLTFSTIRVGTLQPPGKVPLFTRADSYHPLSTLCFVTKLCFSRWLPRPWFQQVHARNKRPPSLSRFMINLSFQSIWMFKPELTMLCVCACAGAREYKPDSTVF